MDKFFINMAVIKVNWDEGKKDILDNYLPLVGYAVKCCDADVVALEDVDAKLREITDFKIPQGAIITMLKRATRPQYRYVKKQELKYIKVPGRLERLNYERLRDEQARRFNALKGAFRSFCTEKYDVSVTEEAADEYFFDILYDIAPSLYKNVATGNSRGGGESQPEITRQYLVSRFIQYVVENDPTSFAALEAFVRGAMLTETFYYASPEDIPRKFHNTRVFFDTSFILRLLGYCPEPYSKPCRELHEMLDGMGVRMNCFRKTLDEVRGILFAAARNKERGITAAGRLDGVFGHFTQNRYSPSDVEYEVATLEDNLIAHRIRVEEHPPHEKLLTIDEAKLDKYISEELQRQREKARYHDIDCLTSIFRLRHGRPQEYLESCQAIFVTTNCALARASTKFFNSEYGISNAPVCMSDQVFTTLVWLKAVNKIPDLPKERLVANCYAALNPSDELWQKYVKEADRLYKSKKIDQHGYAVLLHSLEARRRLMDLTLGDDNVCLEGTVEEVLSSAKAHYLAEAEDRIQSAERKYSALTKNVDAYLARLSTRVSTATYLTVVLVSTVALLFALVKTSPDDIARLIHVRELSAKEVAKGVLFVILAALTVLNIVWGVKLSGPARWISQRISSFVVGRARTRLLSTLRN
jgi:hypothetical protein